jgi:hypothetical protein
MARFDGISQPNLFNSLIFHASGSIAAANAPARRESPIALLRAR